QGDGAHVIRTHLQLDDRYAALPGVLDQAAHHLRADAAVPVLLTYRDRQGGAVPGPLAAHALEGAHGGQLIANEAQKQQAAAGDALDVAALLLHVHVQALRAEGEVVRLARYLRKVGKRHFGVIRGSGAHGQAVRAGIGVRAADELALDLAADG